MFLSDRNRSLRRHRIIPMVENFNYNNMRTIKNRNENGRQRRRRLTDGSIESP
ncbi:hypothetical protein BN938_0477 [Mucinivorans hirudinis]|uniref:Uncharacterized protein n=1 Tax=Mucinivorans hirudinis TaxID=1433126 RepID=A0A060R6I6_9BACT|nr:hypothetical protein BN938_0477 [Mucinivorans hirudinis]